MVDRTVIINILRDIEAEKLRVIPANYEQGFSDALDKCIEIVLKHAPELADAGIATRSDPNRIVAECIVRVGYGTSYYNSETNECEHDNYASIEEVIRGDWSMYDQSMSEALAHDFNLPFNFERYRLTVKADGHRSYIRVERKK